MSVSTVKKISKSELFILRQNPNYVHWLQGNCVFMFMGKCGNSSVKAAILETMGGVDPQLSVHADKRLTYVSSKFIRETDLPIISIVRRPYDRLLSFWRDKVAGRTPANFNFDHVPGLYPDMPFRVMLDRLVCLPDDRLLDNHLVPAVTILNRVNPFAALTVIKFEDLINPARGGWDRLRAATGAPAALPVELPHMNASSVPVPRMPPESAWRLRQRVFKRYYEDYQKWEWEI
jgi:hypothetical protein